MLHWLAHVLGLDNPSSPFYLAWSGFSAQIPRLAILFGVAGAWHRWNCHTSGCWRIARHHVAGTSYSVCGRHHRELFGLPRRLSLHHIRRAHQAANAGDPAPNPSGSEAGPP